MRVLLMPADKSGCGLYRCVMPGRSVVAEYPDDVFIDVAEELNVERDPRTKRVAEVPPDIRRYDLIVLQRPMTQDLYDTVLAIQKQHVSVCVELDDDIARVDAQNQAWQQLRPRTTADNFSTETWDWLLRICQLADWMTVSTPSLTRYGRKDRVSVVRNAVPLSLCQLQRPTNTGPLRIGWSGTVATHPADLQVTRGAVGSALRAATVPVQFHVVGDGVGVQKFLGLPQQPTITGWVPIQDYPEQLAKLDVGLVPLAPSAFNQGKSFLKGLELAALGIPFVASPTSEYVWFKENRDVGVLARRPREWRSAVLQFIEDEAYRLETGARYRAAVQQYDTMQQRAPEWRTAWTRAAEVTRATAFA